MGEFCSFSSYFVGRWMWMWKRERCADLFGCREQTNSKR